MFAVQFQIEGQVQLQRMLAQELPASIKSQMRDFYDDAGSLVIKHTEDIFSTSGANVETAEQWAKLAPATLEAKRRRGEPLQPLIASGKLSKGTKKRTDPLGVTVYNEQMDKYGKYHQSALPRTHLPRRAFLELDNRTRSNIIRLLQVRIHNAVNPHRATTTRLR